MRDSVGMPDRIKVRVLSEEKQLIQRAAELRGLSLSAFVREATTDAAKRVAA